MTRVQLRRWTHCALHALATISPAAGATCLRKLTIWFDPSEPCPLRGGEALSGGSTTALQRRAARVLVCTVGAALRCPAPRASPSSLAHPPAAALSCLTSLSLFGVEAEELPPPGVYISSLQALALDSCKARRVRPCPVCVGGAHHRVNSQHHCMVLLIATTCALRPAAGACPVFRGWAHQAVCSV